jgi:hypothetical protein
VPPADRPGRNARRDLDIGFGRDLCPVGHLPALSRADLRTLVEDENGHVVVDPKVHPEAVLRDFTRPDPLLTFKLDAVAFLYGSKWKQRTSRRWVTTTIRFPRSDVTNKVWRAYMVQPNTDWWVQYFPADNMKRPTGPLCDGCHSVNYNIQTKTVAEWNVGCERCHRPGSEHVRRPGAATIVNPARLTTCAPTIRACNATPRAGRCRIRLPGSITTGPWASIRARVEELLAARRSQAGRDDVHAFRGRHGHKNRMQAMTSRRA